LANVLFFTDDVLNGFGTFELSICGLKIVKSHRSAFQQTIPESQVHRDLDPFLIRDVNQYSLTPSPFRFSKLKPDREYAESSPEIF
jgi:hypothetical protein